MYKNLKREDRRRPSPLGNSTVKEQIFVPDCRSRTIIFQSMQHKIVPCQPMFRSACERSERAETIDGDVSLHSNTDVVHLPAAGRSPVECRCSLARHKSVKTTYHSLYD